jgi:predicted enzyme related to lactoylglutathione lyase
MQRVIGLGGVFFKSAQPQVLRSWYHKHLGIAVEDWGSMFNLKQVQEDAPGAYNVWSPFSESTAYFAPSEKPFMFNFIVHELHPLLDKLREEGVSVIEKTEESEFGKFGWILDPEGNKIELWEPPR